MHQDIREQILSLDYLVTDWIEEKCYRIENKLFFISDTFYLRFMQVQRLRSS